MKNKSYSVDILAEWINDKFSEHESSPDCVRRVARDLLEEFKLDISCLGEKISRLRENSEKTMRSCNQCFHELKISTPETIYSFCINPECPNYGLLQIPAEIVPGEK